MISYIYNLSIFKHALRKRGGSMASSCRGRNLNNSLIKRKAFSVQVKTSFLGLKRVPGGSKYGQ